MESGLTMKCDSGIEVKERQIIRLSDSSRAWVVIAVTQKEIDDDKDGINTDAPGLHCFGGMWYGDDPAKRSSFGKIQWPEDIKECATEIIGTIDDTPLLKIKEIVD